jgi:hypothetical protein
MSKDYQPRKLKNRFVLPEKELSESLASGHDGKSELCAFAFPGVRHDRTEHHGPAILVPQRMLKIVHHNQNV